MRKNKAGAGAVMRRTEQNQMSFEDYFRMYYQPALNYAVTKVTNFDTAEDLVMDAFFNCYKSYERYDAGRGAFASWFFVVLNNRIKNYFRDVKKYEFLEDYMGCTVSYDAVFEEVCMAELQRSLIMSLEELPAVQRKIIVLKYFKNCTSGEIASECGITPGNVRVQLMRAIREVRGRMEKKYSA